MFKNHYFSYRKHFINPIKKSFNANVNNTCIVSVVNNSFAEYFAVFARSIVDHNPYFNFKWVIYSGEHNGYLSDQSKRIMADAYNNVIFKKIDESIYSGLKDRVPVHLFAALFKFELFKMQEYSKIILFDVDTLCLGDISYLFDHHYPLAASLAGGNYQKHVKMQGFFNRRYSWNSGVVVFGKEIIKQHIYDFLIKTQSDAEYADQTILNRYFKYLPKYLLPFEYNFHATIFKDKIQDVDVRILHYAGPKPTNEPDLPQMKYWFEARKKYS